MTEKAMLVALSSPDPDIVLEALFRLGGERTVVPEVAVLEAALRHLEDEDADIRRQVAFSVGIHWAYRPAFARLVAALASEKDEYVAETLIAAIARIGHQSKDVLIPALAALRATFARAGVSRRLRAQAYIEARVACGRMSPGEYAKTTLAPEAIEVDESWWSEVLGDPDTTPP